MSVNRHIHDAANNAARNAAENAASTPSGNANLMSSVFKVGIVLLTAAVALAGGGDAAHAVDSLNEIGKK